MTTRSSSRLQIWSTLLGNAFEHYDTALYGFLAPLFQDLLSSLYSSSTIGGILLASLGVFILRRYRLEAK